MMECDDNFEEEFSNWAKTVLNLQNVRNGSISYIKNKMEPFIDELVQMHGPGEKHHFEELLIKVAVNGEVKQEKSKKYTLHDRKCKICINVFQRILSNFKDSCRCERWERHARKETISPINYWWIVSKLYISQYCEIETSLGPEEVEPFAVLSLMSRCKLFHENLLWFDVGQVILSRHKLMHSINNRLSDEKRDEYLSEMKTLIEKMRVDISTDKVLSKFGEVENLTFALFTEDGEVHELANKALELQDNCLNTDFKSPEGEHTTMKALAFYKIKTKSQELKLNYKHKQEKKEYELQKKELERNNEELKAQINQYKVDDLERKLQCEKEKNETYEDTLTEIKSKMEKNFKNLQQEKNEQDDEISSIKIEMEKNFKDLQQEKNEQDDEISAIKIKMEKNLKDLQQEKIEQGDEISSIKIEMEKNLKDLQQEKIEQGDEISFIKIEMEKNFKDLQQEKIEQGDEISSIKIEMEKNFKDLQQEKIEQDDEIFSIKIEIENNIKDVKQEKSKQDHEISSLKSSILRMMDDIDELVQEKNKQDDEISSLKKKTENKLRDLYQEKRKQDDRLSSLKSEMEKKFKDFVQEKRKKITTGHIYSVQSFTDVDVGIDSNEKACNIRDMCQMSDGTVILIDGENKKLKRLDDKLNMKDFYQFDKTPTHVVPVSSSQVAVLYSSWEIVCFRMLEDTIVGERKVVLKGNPDCQDDMIYCNNQFWILCGNVLYIYSSLGYLDKRIDNLSRDRHSHYVYMMSCTLCTNKEKTRVYAIKDDTVHVLDLDGNVVYAFTLKDKATTMTITMDDIIMAHQLNSTDVVMYDLEGNILGKLIAGKNMLPRPLSMLYDESKCCLIIGFAFKNKLRVFKLQK